MHGVLLLALAGALLLVGAELFVGNAAAAAARLRISVLATGLLLAGAEPEELLTAGIAAVRDRPDFAAGDAIGANLTMLTLVLGLAALARPLPFGPRVRLYALLAAVAALLAWGVLADGRVGRGEGALLLAAYAGLVALVWRRERGRPAIGELAEADGGARPPARSLLLALAGLGLMALGGTFAVDGADRVGAALGRSDTAVGLTLLALATTAELLALALAAARHGVGELAVAGVLGSALYNSTATLGTAALARPLATTGMGAPAAAALALPLATLVLSRPGRLTRPTGALLLAAYAAYVLLVLS